MVVTLDCLFVMGFANSADGELHAVTMARVEAAAQLFHASPNLRVIVTGGHGDNFNRAPLPHRAYCNAILKQRGVPEEQLETRGFLSANTVEDVMMIAAYAGEHGLRRFQVVTSTFHLPRCRLIFACVTPDHEIAFHAARDPIAIETYVAHEERARARIAAQGGVIWGGRLFPLPTTVAR